MKILRCERGGNAKKSGEMQDLKAYFGPSYEVLFSFM